MKIRLLDEAECDLDEGRDFYDGIESGLGDYFAASLASDIESLKLFAGIHLHILDFTARCPSDFRSAFTTSSIKSSSASMPCWI